MLLKCIQLYWSQKKRNIIRIVLVSGFWQLCLFENLGSLGLVKLLLILKKSFSSKSSLQKSLD